VILHAWRQWGEESIHQWRGMFAVALYDEKTEVLTLIRDRPGVKPLHYFWSDGVFLFGSELKSLMVHPSFNRKINQSAVALFLQYGNVPSPHCIFENTHKLLPGHILTFNVGDKNIKTRCYWNVYDHYNQPKIQISLPDAIDETERVLADSFRYRMVADVPVGVFLSGGYDSTCVTALLQKQQTEKIRTFTIGSTDKKLDEAPYAREIASRLGTDHTEFYCSPQDALDVIPDLPYYYDEPFADSSAIPTILVSRLARKQVTVALSADGGDEIFAGYNRYDYIHRYSRKLKAIPEPLRKALAVGMRSLSSDRIPFMRNHPNFHSRYDKLLNLLLDPSAAELMKNLNQVFTETDVTQILQESITLPKIRYNSSELKQAYYDDLSYMMAIDYQTYMLDDILTKVDRATMSASLEGREPFLDQHIIEWTARLPTEYKYHNRQKKYILRQIVHRYIPQELMDRPKMGFAIPVQDWLYGPLKPLVLQYLDTTTIDQQGIFRKETVGQLVRDFYAGRKEKYLRIWHLLMFQMWYQRWMKN
jgi:asparagine synthase (glutamine-hydrolysing)